MASDSIRWFGELRSQDTPLVGGKNSSLGELYSALSAEGVRVPNGFAVIAQAYRDALSEAGAWNELHALLDTVDKTRIADLAERAMRAREIVYSATGTPRLRAQIAAGYHELEKQYGAGVAVAVRSSATAEDLPTASFAGQHESFLQRPRRGRPVRGLPALLCLDLHRPRDRLPHRQRLRPLQGRTVGRRDEDGPLGSRGERRHLHARHRIRLSRRGVRHRRLRARREHRARARSIRTSSTSTSRPSAKATARCCAARSAASSCGMVYARGARDATARGTCRHRAADRARFCIGDAEVLELADYAIRIEEHYSQHAGPPDADGYRMGQGRRGRQALHRSGAARNGRLAARAPALRDLCAEGQRPGAGHRPRGRREDRRGRCARHRATRTTSQLSSRARCWSPRRPAPIGSR